MKFKMITEDSHGVYEKAYRLWCNITNEGSLFDWCNFQKSNTSVGNFPKDHLYLKKQFIQDAINSFQMEAWVHRPRSSSSSDAKECSQRSQPQVFIEDQIIPFLESVVRAVDNQINRYHADGSEQHDVVFPVFSPYSLVALLRSYYTRELDLGDGFKLLKNSSDHTTADLIKHAEEAMLDYDIRGLLKDRFTKNADLKLSSHNNSLMSGVGCYDAARESPPSTPISPSASPFGG